MYLRRPYFLSSRRHPRPRIFSALKPERRRFTFCFLLSVGSLPKWEEILVCCLWRLSGSRFLVHASLDNARELLARSGDDSCELSSWSLERAQDLGAEDVEGRQIGQFHQVLVLKALVVQVTEM